MTPRLSHDRVPHAGPSRQGNPALPHPPPGSRFGHIRQILHERGQPSYRLAALLQGVRSGRITRFNDALELPQALREELTCRLGENVLPVYVASGTSDESVEKVLFKGAAPGYFEAVRSSFREGWSSVCVSSQSGCGLACTFCATGAVGLVRNLSAEEIFAQVFHPPWRADAAFPVKSVAFMGMGEPLANPRIFPALEMLTDPLVGRCSPRRITVSTVGFAPRLEQLVDDHPQVTITLSVHSPFPDQRAELIPLETRFPLETNLEILDRHVRATHRRMFLAYLLIAGVNDSPEHAHELAQLIKARSRPDLFKVSVIPYNEAPGVEAAYSRPSDESVQGFVGRLRAAGVGVRRRRQFGAEIDAACGQLHADYLLDRGNGEDRTRLPTPVVGGGGHVTQR